MTYRTDLLRDCWPLNINLPTLSRETEYLLENMQASVKDSAVSSRQELEQMQQKVRNYYLYVFLMKNVCMYA